MPPRRRHAPTSAAALPASRLPVGTPQIAHTKSPATARTIHHSPTKFESEADSSNSSIHTQSSNSKEITGSSSSPDMAPKLSPNTADMAPATSIAASKLERQQKRIEEANAALTNPPPLEKKPQIVRGKGKWRPLDLTAEQPALSHDSGVPVSETRVNTFRPATSRGSSLSRSMSRQSHRTSETGPSDMERQDSALTDNGFQLFKGRRNKKNVGEWSAYEDRLEERQATVEAAFDEREIYKVFGNALPGPKFIEETVGMNNGQLQFIQHPNGDVSAHQWSNDRYIWENIGQFSNIRKKVEGQLASDRLKGETAYQTLQQNTLAYFRTIAKQREANVMGLPFGPKDIQAAIPEPRTELAAAPTGLKDTMAVTTTIELHQPDQVEPPATKTDEREIQNAIKEPAGKLSYRPAAPMNVPRGPRIDRVNYPTYDQQQTARPEDPFYSNSTYKQIYGGYSYAQAQYNQMSQAPHAGPFFGLGQQPQGLNYNFHFPSTGCEDLTLPGLGMPGYPSQQGPPKNKVEQPNQQSHGGGRADTTGQTHPLYNTSTNARADLFQQKSSDRGDQNPEILAPRPKPITPFNPRASMSDHLWKISETAKERTQSQANIGRTVLYDPLQSHPTTTNVDDGKGLGKQDALSLFSDTTTEKTFQPPHATLDAASSRFFPPGLTPQKGHLSSPYGSLTENNLQDSSPDAKYTVNPYQQSMPMIMRTSEARPTPQIVNRSTFQTGGPFQDPERTANLSGSNEKTYDEELNDWWTSGNKFARQEEFFQSIKAANKFSNSALCSPPAHLTPIGPPSRTPKKQESSPFNDGITRMLIPVLENLSSYVQGPYEKRRDYFCQWSQPPEWCIDRSEHGNDSFFDKDWGQPPARVGRDPRYSGRWSGEQSSGMNRFNTLGRYPSGYGSPSVAVGSQLDRRFAFGGF